MDIFLHVLWTHLCGRFFCACVWTRITFISVSCFHFIILFFNCNWRTLLLLIQVCTQPQWWDTVWLSDHPISPALTWQHRVPGLLWLRSFCCVSHPHDRPVHCQPVPLHPFIFPTWTPHPPHLPAVQMLSVSLNLLLLLFRLFDFFRFSYWYVFIAILFILSNFLFFLKNTL